MSWGGRLWSRLDGEAGNTAHVPRGLTKCPQCGASVSQFAAGCAICGADLVAARADRGTTLSDRIAGFEPDFLRSAESRKEIVLVALMALVTFFFPLAGLFLCGFIAFTRHRDGDDVMRNIALLLTIASLFQLTTVRNSNGIGWELLFA
jgi:hypothetical protein